MISKPSGKFFPAPVARHVIIQDEVSPAILCLAIQMIEKGVV